jgi:branched-chain amino acid transport system substrate-binding protein
MSTVAVFSLGVSAIGLSGASAAQTSSAPGVTSNSVTLGLLADITGPLANPFAGSVQGAQAAIDQQNAQGGVNGRKIKLVIGDDQSNPDNALTVTQSLVQQKNSFAILEVSAFFSLVYKYLEQASIPGLAGVSFDGGPEWSAPSTFDLVNGAGAALPTNANFTWFTKLLKQQKITKLAIIAYGNSAQAVEGADALATSAQAAGIPVVDKDVSPTQTQTDFSANALRVKNSGANGVLAVLAGAGGQALLEALHQEDAHVTTFFQGGYSSDLVEPPTVSAAQGTVVTSWFRTSEFGDDQVVAAMRKYLGYKGPQVPANATGIYFGWAAATLAIQGLKGAGKDLTATSFLNALHKLNAYTAGGLQAPVNLAQSKQGTYVSGTAGNCAFGLKVEGKKYVPTATTPYCATIPKS